MKRSLLFILLLLLFTLVASAQTISVKSFRALPTDMTASSIEGKRIDQNGEVAALIRVVTSETGFVFEGGTLGIVDTKQKVGEIWVWVPRGARKISIMHQQLGVLREYRYPIEIESERTYEMVLTTARIETIIKEEIREQYLMFQISPPDAVLEVNDQLWTVSPTGNANKLVSFGTYTYRVQAPNYHTEAGNVTVNDPENTHRVEVTLQPNFGWIEVPGTDVLQGALVYIDNSMIGKAPCKSEGIKSGKHNVKIMKDLYESFSTTVTVNDNEVTTVSPELVANFAHVTLQVDSDAEIWINDEKKGTRTWTGNLAFGVYRVECQQVNHEPSKLKLEVTNQMSEEVIKLEAPKPILSTLLVESEPAVATIYIDGNFIGETPKIVKDIPVGQHEIRLTKDGYADYSETIIVKKKERAQVSVTLSPIISPMTSVAKPQQPQFEKPQTAPRDKSFFVTLNGAYSVAPQWSFGVTFGQVKRFGWFVSLMSNGGFRASSAAGSCYANLGDGMPDGWDYETGSMPYYNGEYMTDRNSVIIGGIGRLAKPLYFKVGAGYGFRNLYWLTEDDTYYLNESYSYKGLEMSAGMQLNLGGFVMSLEAVTTSFKTLEGKFGLGFAF